MDLASTTATSSTPAILIGAPLIAGAVLVIASWRRTPAALGANLGPPDWDFSSSWASTIAGVGAILGTILGASVVPADPRYLSAAAYTGLNLFFGVLVVLAPFVFAATRVRISQDDTGLHYEGFVWSFLLASALTLWAVLGELATLGVLFWELQRAQTLSWWSVGPIWVLIACSLLMTALYAFRTVGWILGLAQTHQTRVAEIGGRGAAQAPAAPPWTPL